MTRFAYYTASEANAGQVKSRTDPNLKITYYDYNACGQLVHTWGNVPYPEERVYDPAYGELTELRTFRDGANWASYPWPGGANPDVTTWQYHPATGLLLWKRDAASRGYTNVYDKVGTLLTRTWARGTTVTNQFSVFGDILRQDYSDGTHSGMVAGYTSPGRPIQVTDGFGTRTFAYDEDGDLLSETFEGDSPFYGVTLTNRIHSLYGRDRVAADLGGANGSTDLFTEYSFDPASGRPAEVRRSMGGIDNAATYSYLPNSDQISTVAFNNGSTRVVTTSKGWEYGYRLRSTQTRLGTAGAVLSSWSYDYDEVDRRTRATLADSSYWS
ncbi:MAG: hypothetical protein AAB466_03645 [Verrucomicrobiota bacterium]